MQGLGSKNWKERKGLGSNDRVGAKRNGSDVIDGSDVGLCRVNNGLGSKDSKERKDPARIENDMGGAINRSGVIDGSGVGRDRVNNGSGVIGGSGVGVDGVYNGSGVGVDRVTPGSGTRQTGPGKGGVDNNVWGLVED